MSALPIENYLTPQEYLEVERSAASKSDYLNGIIVAMAGSKHRHNVIASNLIGQLHSSLRERPCIVFGSDMNVRIEKANVFRYPDVSAVCGQINFYDETEDSYTNPNFICEILSPSTARVDRNEKFAEYRLIESFGEYLLLDQDSLAGELHRKSDNDRWSSATYTRAEDQIQLESISVELRLGDLYEKTELDQ